MAVNAIISHFNTVCVLFCNFYEDISIGSILLKLFTNS